MNRFRTFRNDDPPALATLWRHGLPRHALVHGIDAHRFDSFVAAKPGFDADGLILAERNEQLVGFVHAGFGPVAPEGPSHALDPELGTIAMLVLDPDLADAETADGLMRRGIDYLRARGAKVIYAGGQAPLNPFYWGIYGGSEFSGILADHVGFIEAVERTGFQPVSTTTIYEADLTASPPRDPKGVILRRQTLLESEEDALLPRWWDAVAVGEFRPTRYHLINKPDGVLLASAWTWEMSGHSLHDRRTRLGLVDLQVHPAHRRKGFGRHLVGEILRRARGEWVEAVSVQTADTNVAAKALYESLDFNVTGRSLLYRLP